MKTPEGYEKDDVCKYLRSINAYFVRISTFGYGGSGHSDIIACIDGTFWGLEIKRPGREPTALQKKRIAEIILAGGQAVAGDANHIINAIKVWRAV